MKRCTSGSTRLPEHGCLTPLSNHPIRKDCHCNYPEIHWEGTFSINLRRQERVGTFVQDKGQMGLACRREDPLGFPIWKEIPKEHTAKTEGKGLEVRMRPLRGVKFLSADCCDQCPRANTLAVPTALYMKIRTTATPPRPQGAVDVKPGGNWSGLWCHHLQ